ncbi:MAG: thioredoxin family protein, partial [Candidatus Micrarchaeaceae archaeon]
DISAGKSRLSESTKTRLKSIDKPVDIKVFVTPTCPYCPKAVRMAHQFAMENKNIKASMIEATEFEEMSNAYGVMAVPKIVINDKASFEGALPEEAFLQQVMDAASNGR